ncbi:MAG: antitoxin [Nanoarchaeota archaeon]
MVYARISINEYTNKVLNVIKAKFDLRDKSEAINKFIEMFGDEVVEKEANDEYVKKIIATSKKHFNAYGYQKMSKKEFDELFELN